MYRYVKSSNPRWARSVAYLRRPVPAMFSLEKAWPQPTCTMQHFHAFSLSWSSPYRMMPGTCEGRRWEVSFTNIEKSSLWALLMLIRVSQESSPRSALFQKWSKNQSFIGSKPFTEQALHWASPSLIKRSTNFEFIKSELKKNSILIHERKSSQLVCETHPCYPRARRWRKGVNWRNLRNRLNRKDRDTPVE